MSARPPGELKPGEYRVVLDHAAVGTLLEFLGWLAFNGLAHAEQRGALSGRLGERVARPLRQPRRLAARTRHAAARFDAEGVPKRPLPLIQDGIAHAVVHDTRSAAQAARELNRPRARPGRRARRSRAPPTSCWPAAAPRRSRSSARRSSAASS